MADITSSSLPGVPKNDSRLFGGIYIASFAVLLVIALVSQLMFLHWRTWFPGAEGEKTLIGGVRAAVYTFMSHLT